MKNARQQTGEAPKTDRFDDEITLPIRIVCERKLLSREDSKEEPLRRSAGDRDLVAAQKPWRAV